MSKTFKRGGRVEWNSEAGRVRGTVMKKAISDVKFKGYIKSDKSDHVALHKGSALRLLKSSPKKSRKRSSRRRRTKR